MSLSTVRPVRPRGAPPPQINARLAALGLADKPRVAPTFEVAMDAHEKMSLLMKKLNLMRLPSSPTPPSSKPSQPFTSRILPPATKPTATAAALREPLSARDANRRDPPHVEKVPREKDDEFLPASAISTPSTSSATPTPMTPQDALARFGHVLSEFEQKEIQQYSEIYYCGQMKKPGGAQPRASGRTAFHPIRAENHGFDDEKGNYKCTVDDHIAYRYRIVSHLGHGSFGQVVKAIDVKTGASVAVKVIKNRKKFHEQALVEVKVLRHLNRASRQQAGRKNTGGAKLRKFSESSGADDASIITILESFLFRNHMCIIFTLEGMNLYELTRMQRFAPFPVKTIRNFARQLLQCLALSHQERVVHCDLKPENVLLRKHASADSIVVIDFGSSCFEHEKLYTYIQSRFYRAPEIMLGIPYTTAIDMWSLGCILCELANGYPIFPGENEVEQLQCIMEFLGVPPRKLLDRAPRQRTFFDSTGAPRVVPNSRGRVRRPDTKALSQFLRNTDAQLLNFIGACLKWEPEKRLAPREALLHPFITGVETVACPASKADQPAADFTSGFQLPTIVRRYH